MASPTSLHMSGRALDWKVDGLTPAQCAQYAEAVPEFCGGGIGIYDTFVHSDVRLGKRRWAYVGGLWLDYEEVRDGRRETER